MYHSSCFSETLKIDIWLRINLEKNSISFGFLWGSSLIPVKELISSFPIVIMSALRISIVENLDRRYDTSFSMVGVLFSFLRYFFTSNLITLYFNHSIQYADNLIGLSKTSFLAEVLSEDVDKDANDFVQFELVDVAGKTDLVGDEQLFFLGVTKKKQDQCKHIIDFDQMYNRYD
jgi:hypothetical protein